MPRKSLGLEMVRKYGFKRVTDAAVAIEVHPNTIARWAQDCPEEFSKRCAFYGVGNLGDGRAKRYGQISDAEYIGLFADKNSVVWPTEHSVPGGVGSSIALSFPYGHLGAIVIGSAIQQQGAWVITELHEDKTILARIL